MVAPAQGQGRDLAVRALVTGSLGQLGSEFVSLISARDGDVVLGLDRPDIDITDPQSVATALAAFEPDVVINCAAWTAVDEAETQEAAALLVNGEGPRVLAAACAGRRHTMPSTRPTAPTHPARTRPRSPLPPTGLGRMRFPSTRAA